ncbi:Leu/Phe/Val dehydrogenase [Paenibacillus paeoniae]|uniref:Glu/Leu/Phe/Val dehydrogenase n=1 Tax=Paenibacillus paeoniae TaxID=2292705 RepID=A0A371P602_9BACL|nr:Glu/Leu/Phe/Val dehydrogenase dimerization domain-containing protein [Paenibacillus paeoniae]REK71285.1 Glu/Leu/Phe/Val dehydrogenase [Paenibacillus paeoniae]
MDAWRDEYEQLLFLQDRSIGFKAVIAIHNTSLGPSLGGCRIRQYASDQDAVADALRLARSMTYKSALAGVPYGGGKAVILASPDAGPRDALFRTLGKHIQKLQGQYITGMDLGTTVADMDTVRQETTFVTDTSGSLGAVGDLTAKMTAYGVFLGIGASLRRLFGSESLLHRSVAVQGLGKVGYQLCRYLKEAGARLTVTDLDARLVRKAAKEFGASVSLPANIMAVPCDVLAPCALGGVLDDGAIGRLNCRIVAGAANNQLAEERHGDKLRKRGILYAPDYVINAGGIIVTASELSGGDAAQAKRNVESIYGTLTRVYDLAEAQSLSTSAAANRLAENLFRA